MIYRDITDQLIENAHQFSAIAIVGPRQSGKTTLVQNVFKNHTYVSLEDLDMREFAQTDARRFLDTYRDENAYGIIIDEIQHVPTLLSYIQTIIDSEPRKGYFIITGSQNLLVNEAVTQTLAGRIAIMTLFPLSINEIQKAGLLSDSIEEMTFTGGYPRLYVEKVSPVKLYNNYINGYIERDVRQVKNINNLALFQTFVRLCAGRIGQILNVSSLANDCGIDQKTASSWLSLLEATYVIFLLQPYYKNYGKRLIKSPKLYFVDTGIACSLLGIKSPEELSAFYLRGSLIESFLISDFYKQFYNLDQKPSLYYWRDSAGNEVDCIIEQALQLTPVEIKAGKTISKDYFKQFDYLEKLPDFPQTNNIVVYAGGTDQQRENARVLSWQHTGNLIKSLL